MADLGRTPLDLIRTFALLRPTDATPRPEPLYLALQYIRSGSLHGLLCAHGLQPRLLDKTADFLAAETRVNTLACGIVNSAMRACMCKLSAPNHRFMMDSLAFVSCQWIL